MTLSKHRSILSLCDVSVPPAPGLFLLHFQSKKIPWKAVIVLAPKENEPLYLQGEVLPKPCSQGCGCFGSALVPTAQGGCSGHTDLAKAARAGPRGSPALSGLWLHQQQGTVTVEEGSGHALSVT